MTTASKIVYADDDSDDRFFLNESLLSNGLHADNLVYLSNGQEVISYIEHSPETLPSLVVLDLNMPRMNGKETLNYLKAHPVYQTIPVIILSTSENKKEMADCAARGALSYFVKPHHMSGYDRIIKAFMPFLPQVC